MARVNTLDVLIPISLYEASKANADTLKIPLGAYSLGAIKLLGCASTNSWNTTDTHLITEAGPIDIPHLATPRSKSQEINKTLAIRNMSDETRLEFLKFARDAKLSRSERARRALRFRNFVVDTVGDDHPTFQHKDSTATTFILF